MNVSLTPRLESFVRGKVDSGRYNSSSEVVREALRLLEQQDSIQEAKLTALRGDIRHAIDQVERAKRLPSTWNRSNARAEHGGIRPMPSVTYSPDFRQDAAEVWDYIGDDSPARADAVLDSIAEAIQLIAENPMLGRSREDLASGVRSVLAAKRYLIYYSTRLDGAVVMLRLFHTSRDVDGLF